MTASNTCLTQCPEDMKASRLWLAKEIAAMSEDEAKELIQMLIQRGIFSAEDFSAARDKLKEEG